MQKIQRIERTRQPHRFDTPEDQGLEEQEAPAFRETASPIVEISLPRDAFTTSIADTRRLADLGNLPTSLNPPAPGSPAAAYTRAAELRQTDVARGGLINTVV